MLKFIVAAVLTLSLLVGQDGVDGLALGPGFLGPDTMSVLFDGPGAGAKRDLGVKPLRACTRLSCTQTLFVPERLAFVMEADAFSGHSLRDDRRPPSTTLQQDPPIPRA